MGDGVDSDAAFWLPAQFLTDGDFLVDKECFGSDPIGTGFGSGPYGFDPFGCNTPAVNSPVESAASSTETERDEEDELLAELTRQLGQASLQQTHNSNSSFCFNRDTSEKSWVFSTSPQSTLAGLGGWSCRSGLTSNGSPNGPSQVPSPPASPPGLTNDDARELLYAAAGEVARMKLKAHMAQINQQQQHNSRGLLNPSMNASPLTKSYNLEALLCNQNASYSLPYSNHFQQVKRQQGNSISERQGKEGWYSKPHAQQIQGKGLDRRMRHDTALCGGGGGALGLPQSAWPPLRPPHYHPHHQYSGGNGGGGGSGMRAMFLNGSGPGSGMKKQSTGTGVFLPRRYGTQPEPRKKPTGCSTVLLPAKVVNALNLNLEDMNTPHFQRFGSGFVTEHEILMAKRNAMMGQQRRSSRPQGAMVNHEIHLPQEWTY